MARFQRIPMNRKALMLLMGDTPNESLRIGKLDRKETAQECFTYFLQACEQVYQDNTSQNLDGIFALSVGLKPMNRSGVYDLLWFPKQPKFCYCADVETGEFVYRLDLGLGEHHDCSCCHH